MSHPAPDHSNENAAAQAVRHHHAELASGLDQRTESLTRLLESEYLLRADRARADLLDFVRREILPHAEAEERVLYPAAAACPGGGPLVDGMISEHRAIASLVDELAEAGTAVRAAAAGRALAALFAVHLAKENDLILPLVVAAPDVSLADLLAGMHELLGAGEADPSGTAGRCADGGCGCGGDGGCGEGGCGGGCDCGGHGGATSHALAVERVAG